MGCRDFFRTNTENKERCKALQEVSAITQIAWEMQSASEFSPGPVSHDEVLFRQVLNPTHFDPVNGTIKPNFFDDASDKGASVNRLGWTTIAKLRQSAQLRVNVINVNPPSTGPRELIGYTTITVSEVRSVFIDTPPRRALGVYDTAKPNDPSHADICQLVTGKRQGKSVRAQLYMLAKTRLVRFELQ
jgi:hypothetical protein